ncbi:MAG: T9SS type A sorting domain-containing protein, partial [Bacteroidales bacterium]|nr:T9SS type A sorting domain-containing protein [Bacteroidales bacterium]
ILISDLYNYPNPFSDKTNFVFAHNQAGYLMNLDLYIFSIGGNLVKTISTTLSSENITDNVLYWDGKSDNGSSVENGMYIYKLVITNENGTVSSSSGKMIKNR